METTGVTTHLVFIENQLKRSEQQIRASVQTITKEIQDDKELYRENFHRALTIAQHTDCLWKKAKWR